MYALVENEHLLQTEAENGREDMPYVVRDLSWELARYLETEASRASVFAASDSTRRS